MRKRLLANAVLLAVTLSAQSKFMQSKLIVFDPGHFHATLLQKDIYPGSISASRFTPPSAPTCWII